MSVVIVITTVSVVFLLTFGLLRLYLASTFRISRSDPVQTPFIEVLVPVKGLSDFIEPVIISLLNQSYKTYQINFIVEDENDSALPLLRGICGDYSHATVLVAGKTRLEGQKNHNLAFAAARLRPDTNIIVTCDANSVATPDWLDTLTLPIRSGRSLAVTTFRTFRPDPLSVAGVCQAIYGSILSLLIAIKPKPWGGSTAIRRDVFDQLDVQAAWNETVVDDLALGNLLTKAGIPLRLSTDSVMETPLGSQTFRGFLSFLHRQILFPKFTNPGIWMSSMVWQFLISASLVMSVIAVCDWFFNYSINLALAIALGYLFTLTGVFVALNILNPHRISLTVWLLASLPTLALTAYVYLHSIFINYIDWGGKRYYCGRKGVVKKIEALRQ